MDRLLLRKSGVTFTSKLLGWGLLLIVPISTVRADQHRPTLEEVLATALKQNPDVIESRLSAVSARGDQRIARGLPNPSYSIIPANPFQYSLTEPIDLGPQRLFRTRAAAHAYEASTYDEQDMVRQVTFAVRQSFYDLLLAESLRNVTSEQSEIVRKLLVADSVRWAAGDISQTNVTRSELEFARAEAALARAQVGVINARLNLQLLMGIAQPDSNFAVSGELRYLPLSLPTDSLSEYSRTRRPDVAAASQRVRQNRALHTLAWSQFLPTPALTWVHQPDEPFPSGSHNALGISLTVPILYWFGGERQKASADLEHAKTEQQRLAASAQTELAVALENYTVARQLAERYHSDLLAKADTAMETTRYAYEHGAGSLLDLLDAIRAHGDVQSDYFTAVHDYWVSVYALCRATGTDLIQGDGL